MFRALLWKEWRELWMLPIAAVPLAAISFFAAQADERVLNPSIWDTSFFVWLPLAAFYVPTHLYARERNLDTSYFLLAKPLDRFRLWCFKFAIGLTVLLAIGLVLYGVMTILGFSHERTGTYGLYRANIIRTSAYLSLLVLSVSSFSSTLFRRQLTAMIGPAVILFIVRIFWGFTSMFVEPIDDLWDFFMDDMARSSVRLLPFCPILLFTSLFVFTRADLRRRTRTYLSVGYAIPAALVILLTGLGIFQIYPEIQEEFRPSAERLRTVRISPDGTRMVLNIEPGRFLVTLDLAERRANRIGRGKAITVKMNPKNNAIVFTEYGKISRLFSKAVLADFSGSERGTLFGNSPFKRGLIGILTEWSQDGKHFGFMASSMDGKFVGVADSSGKILGTYEFPKLEQDLSVLPLGWDSESRFYFSKTDHRDILSGDYLPPRTYWRVRADNVTPERIAFIPADTYLSPLGISPHGRWIAYDVQAKGSDQSELWLYDATVETTARIFPEVWNFDWSTNGVHIAYLELLESLSNGEEETPSLRLVLYNPATAKRSFISLEVLPDIDYIHSWSPTDSYVLLGGEDSEEHYVFSVKAGRFNEVQPPSDTCRLTGWISHDRLLWQHKKKLIATEPDGSNLEEVFRIEDGTMYLYGKEQS